MQVPGRVGRNARFSGKNLGLGLRKLLPATGVIWALRAQSGKKSPK